MGRRSKWGSTPQKCPAWRRLSTSICQSCFEMRSRNIWSLSMILYRQVPSDECGLQEIYGGGAGVATKSYSSRASQQQLLEALDRDEHVHKQGRPSSSKCKLVRRSSLLPLGGKTPPDRGGMGTRRKGRSEWIVPVGQSTR